MMNFKVIRKIERISQIENFLVNQRRVIISKKNKVQKIELLLEIESDQVRDYKVQKVLK